MGRNEIRLRRSAMTSGRIAQHRNYSDIMARHERDVKLKRIIRAFIYFLAIAFIIVLFFIVHRIQQKKDQPEKAPISLVKSR
jgi:large-conductance mechanosensitive channel